MFRRIKNDIVVKLLGGLGNQLFQYATARALADRHGADLWIDLSGLESDPLRCFELDAFNVRCARLESRAERLLPKPARKLVVKLRLAGVPICREPGFAFSPVLKQLSPPAILEGYWQSEKYFVQDGAVLRQDLRLSSPAGAAAEMLADSIRGGNAISVHVRRGDYALNPATNAYHGLLPLEYYREGVELMRATVEQPRFFVFSDDPEWVGTHLDLGPDSTVIGRDCPKNRSYEDLWLMSLCKHHIIANSSFSWWGAWLAADHPGRKVISPRRWFKAALVDDRDLIPGTWTRI